MATIKVHNARAPQPPSISAGQGTNFVLVVVALFLVLLIVPFHLGAQESAKATISIRVTDPSGTGVPHVTLRLDPPPLPTPAKMETDDKGQLELALDLGGYALFASAPGFKMATIHIRVQEAKGVQVVPVRLEIGATGSPMVYQDAVTPTDELRISAHAYHLVLKVVDLKAMPRTTVTVHNEHAKADETYVGVRVADVLAKIGAPLGMNLRGAALSGYIVATGSDGYVAVLALAEVDPTFHSGEVLVADTMNAAPLDAKSGPFKLVVTEDKRPARWVRNLVTIELKSAK